jgi:hypothetical protein
VIDLLGLSAIAALSGMYSGTRFVRCDRCVSHAHCAQTQRCGLLDAQANIAAQEQLRAYWQSNDPNTFDLAPGDVREVREMPSLPNCTKSQTCFTRCDQCRSREACEREHRCSIIEGEHKPSAAFIDFPYDWRADAIDESEGGNCD